MGMNAESFTFQIGGKTATIDKKNFNKFFKKVLPKKEKPDDGRRLLKEHAIDEEQQSFINELQQQNGEQQATIDEQQAINEEQQATIKEQQAINEQQQAINE